MFKRSSAKGATLVRVAALAAVCTAGACAQGLFGAPQSINLKTLVVVGDSLSAGFQNYSLLDTQQVHAYPALIAQQAGVPLTLPLVPAPGVPNVLQLVTLGPPPVVAPMPGTLPAIPRDYPLQQATDLAVPGMYVADVLNKAPNPTVVTAVDAMTNIVLGFPTPFVVPGPALTQVQQAAALKPTTIILWIGANDVLFSAMTGDQSMLTPLPSFTTSYFKLMSDLAKTGARILVANIPDVSIAPFFTPVSQLVAETGLPQGQVMKALGVGPHDYLRPGALPIAFQILEGHVAGPLPATCPISIPGLPVTTSPCVMTSAQATLVRLNVDAFNLVILTAALINHATLVDTHTLLTNLSNNGYNVNGYHLTTNFLGGLITLDGIHPSNTLHAILANKFIDTINSQFGMRIADVNVGQVAAQDPLVPANLKH